MPLVVPGICRYTINQTYGARNVANIVDIDLNNNDITATRADIVADYGRVLLQNWHDRIRPNIVNELRFDQVSWVDLDSEDGSVGSTTTGIGTAVWPAVGVSTAAGMPGNVAMLVKKTLATGRGRRDGRWYLCGVGEDKTADDIPNTLIASFVSGMNTALAGLLGDLDGNETSPDYEHSLHVVHILTRDVDGNPLTGDSRQVSALTIDPTLATQRERLRG